MPVMPPMAFTAVTVFLISAVSIPMPMPFAGLNPVFDLTHGHTVAILHGNGFIIPGKLKACPVFPKRHGLPVGLFPAGQIARISSRTVPSGKLIFADLLQDLLPAILDNCNKHPGIFGQIPQVTLIRKKPPDRFKIRDML